MPEALDRLRALCLALPGATEKEAWGSPTFRVNDRIFAMARQGDRGVAVWCNAAEGAQEHLVAADPDVFFRPPYVGGKGWVGMRLDGEADWPAAAELLRRAHALTLAKGRKR